MTIEHSNLNTYNRSVTDIYINTIGGEPWKMAADYSYDNWVDSLKIYPATVEVKLAYILDIIREQYFYNLVLLNCTILELLRIV